MPVYSANPASSPYSPRLKYKQPADSIQAVVPERLLEQQHAWGVARATPQLSAASVLVHLVGSDFQMRAGLGRWARAGGQRPALLGRVCAAPALQGSRGDTLNEPHRPASSVSVSSVPQYEGNSQKCRNPGVAGFLLVFCLISLYLFFFLSSLTFTSFSSPKYAIIYVVLPPISLTPNLIPISAPWGEDSTQARG